MTNLIIQSLVWLYLLRAAWTAGVIYGWTSAMEEQLHTRGFIQSSLLWPWTLYRGWRANKRRGQ